MASFESSVGYFSGAELGTSANEQGVPVTPGVGPERTSFGSDELEGLAEDRVIAQGYLLCLKNVSGVRQWKRRWVVLRGRSLTLYKNFEVPSPLLSSQLLSRNTSAMVFIDNFYSSRKLFLSSPHPFLSPLPFLPLAFCPHSFKTDSRNTNPSA